MQKIKYIVADIDGVLTDGKVYIDANGNENKTICYHDLDSIRKGRDNGLEFAFVTGEDTDMARFIAKRFKVSNAVYGAKDKEKAVNQLLKVLNLSRDEICYVGDSERDIPAIKLAGIGAAPADALKCVKEAADIVLECKGGEGVLSELVYYVIKNNSVEG